MVTQRNKTPEHAHTHKQHHHKYIKKSLLLTASVLMCDGKMKRVNHLHLNGRAIKLQMIKNSSNSKCPQACVEN